MPFDFILQSSLLLPAFIQGLLFAFLLFYRGRIHGRLSDTLLGWLLLLNAIKIAYWMLGYAGWYDTHNGYTSFMFYFPFNNLPWMGPLLYFYFLSLSNADFRFTKAHRKHLILPLAWTGMIIAKLVGDFLLHHPFPAIADSQFGTKGPWAEWDKMPWAMGIGYLSFFYYLFITIRAFSGYQQYVKENFSDTENISLGWLRNILYLVSAGVVLFFVFEIIGLLTGGNSYRFDWYAYLALGIIVYYLSIAGYGAKARIMQHLHFVPVIEKQIPAATETHAVIDTVDPLRDKLLQLMETEKPFLQPELTLTELAGKMKTNTSVMSKLINDGTGRNFNDFINAYRTEEVITKLKSGEQKTQTLLGIAYDAGFNSKATFNRAFKKYTGLNPRDWLEKNNATQG